MQTTVETQNARVTAALSVINAAVAQFSPSHIFALFSGGGDSRTAALVASKHPRFSGCIHINTGIGIPATRQHVFDTCHEQGWPLLEYKAMENTKADGTPDPMIYENIVMKYGFPGKAQHQAMYIKLKERQIARMMREHFGGHVLLVSGARAEESDRRMGKGQVLQKDGRRIWLNAIWDWSKLECVEVLERAKVPPNEAAIKFGRSGECCCGAFAKPGELNDLERACPFTANRIRDLQKRVSATGFPWGWEESPPQWWIDQQRGQVMFDFGETVISNVEPRLCTSCKWRAG